MFNFDFDDAVIGIDLDENPFPPNLSWVDDDSLPNEDMIPDNEFIRITKWK